MLPHLRWKLKLTLDWWIREKGERLQIVSIPELLQEKKCSGNVSNNWQILFFVLAKESNWYVVFKTPWFYLLIIQSRFEQKGQKSPDLWKLPNPARRRCILQMCCISMALISVRNDWLLSLVCRNPAVSVREDHWIQFRNNLGSLSQTGYQLCSEVGS